MIVVENSKPSLNEFKELMARIDNALNEKATIDPTYFVSRSASDIEKDVRDAAVECAKNTKFEGCIQLVSGVTFPDIVAAKYFGIEVKSSKSNHWKTIGNSILESTRVEGVERIFITFGKLGYPTKFISRPYEECLSGIAVTHHPRYQIDMELEAGDTIFDKMGIPYDELRRLNNPVAPVAQYYKSILKPGQSLWWMGDSTEEVAPVTVRLWKSLTVAEKKKLEATVYVYFPETIMSSRYQHKYDRATLWLVTQQSVVNSNLRDSFSAGGKQMMQTVDGRSVEMPRVFYKIAERIDKIAEVFALTSNEILAENWQEEVSTNRVKQWINLVVAQAPTMHSRENAQGVLEKIFSDYGVLEP